MWGGGLERKEAAVGERWLSVDEAARRLVVPTVVIRRWLRTGRFQGRQIGDETLIAETEVIALMRGECDLVFTKEWEREQDTLLETRERALEDTDPPADDLAPHFLKPVKAQHYQSDVDRTPPRRDCL